MMQETKKRKTEFSCETRTKIYLKGIYNYRDSIYLYEELFYYYYYQQNLFLQSSRTPITYRINLIKISMSGH